MRERCRIITLAVILACLYSIAGFSPSQQKFSLAGQFRVFGRLFSNPSSSFGTPEDVSGVLSEYMEEIKALRGTPELVDRLESWASKHPGIEMNIDLFRSLYPFPLDDFQIDGLKSLMAGNNVLVTTPTGSGKTIVGELAIYFSIMLGLRVAYTTPLKALSNQKYADFKAKYGGDRVGLLTGDIAINRGAAITVMTTEVFRNMIYDKGSQNQLSNLFMVCFDEFHFMNDPDRGTVWEESVISCPKSVRILALSATMGNVVDIQGWMRSIHGPTELVNSDHRPVPLRYLYGMKQGLFPLFRDPFAGPGAAAGVRRTDGQLDPGCALNPSIVKVEEQHFRKAQAKTFTRGGRPVKTPRSNPQAMIPSYCDIVEELQAMEQTPAIVFIFSRAGCEQAAKMVMRDLSSDGEDGREQQTERFVNGKSIATKRKKKRQLLTRDELAFVNQAITKFAAANPDIPIAKQNVQMLRSGVGVHHAGLITVWKAFIEDLFNANKIKVLFATETLAAGVNMPARTTVVSTVTKRINSEVVRLKTSQLLQMAGRAGRRGKDTQGTVIVLKNRFEDSKLSHKILSSPIDGIKSHFKTSYGLTVKLLETKSMDECKALIERGFGAFLLQKRMEEKREKAVQSERDAESDLLVAQYKRVLRHYSLAGAKDYLKLVRRLDKERRNCDFLMERLVESERELVQAISDYMPRGTGVLLRTGESGFFLGDVKWGSDNRYSGLGIITSEGKQVYVAQKEHIRSFADTGYAIATKHANALLETVGSVRQWLDLTPPPAVGVSFPGSRKKTLKRASADMVQLLQEAQARARAGSERDSVARAEAIAEAMRAVEAAGPFPVQQLPGSILRQQQIVDDLQEQLLAHPVSLSDGAEDAGLDTDQDRGQDGDGMVGASRVEGGGKDFAASGVLAGAGLDKSAGGILTTAGSSEEWLGALPGDGNLVIEALQYAVRLKNPAKFVKEAMEDDEDDEEDEEDAEEEEEEEEIEGEERGAGGGIDKDKKKKKKEKRTEVFAWRMFRSVHKILQQFHALEGEEGTRATDLGQIVGSLSADNELWIALVLERLSELAVSGESLGTMASPRRLKARKEADLFMDMDFIDDEDEDVDELGRSDDILFSDKDVEREEDRQDERDEGADGATNIDESDEDGAEGEGGGGKGFKRVERDERGHRGSSSHPLTEGELGAIICGVAVDGFKASNAYFKRRPSERMQRLFEDLEPRYLELRMAQNMAKIDFPVYLSIDAAGMVQRWVEGASWRDLCKETSLDQGDICRMLRRTLELLRQIPEAYGVRPELMQLAYNAAEKMDRFPVADFDTGAPPDPSASDSDAEGETEGEVEKGSTDERDLKAVTGRGVLAAGKSRAVVVERRSWADVDIDQLEQLDQIDLFEGEEEDEAEQEGAGERGKDKRFYSKDTRSGTPKPFLGKPPANGDRFMGFPDDLGLTSAGDLEMGMEAFLREREGDRGVVESYIENTILGTSTSTSSKEGSRGSSRGSAKTKTGRNTGAIGEARSAAVRRVEGGSSFERVEADMDVDAVLGRSIDSLIDDILAENSPPSREEYE